MARAVTIFADVSQGALFFEGVRIPPAPLGGVVVAIENPNRPGKIRVTRSDQFNKDGVTPRRLFKRIDPVRVKNATGQFLVDDLGFSLAQVIDYINGQATKNANDIDFQRNSSAVGSGNTVNFTGAGVSAVTLSGGVATVNIVGGGNPVSSGVVTGTGNTTLRLTLEDSTNVDIDVTNLRTITSIGTSTNYFFLNNGAQLSNNQHDKDGGVVFHGTKLRRGEEMLFAIPAEDLHVGIWNGGTGVTGITNVNNKSNWSTKWYYDHSDDDWDAKNGTFAGTGVELNKDIVVENGTYAIRFDYESEKLQLWEISTAYDWLLSSANVAVGATETHIFFSSEEGTQASTPGNLPSVSQIRSQEWTLESFNTTPRPGHSIYEGVEDDDVWKSTRSMRPGHKMKATIGDQTKLQYWGVGYGGTTGNGDGPLNPYSDATGSWRSNSSNVLKNEENATLNQNYTARNTGSTTLTLDLTGRNISWRYNSDNSWDLFDEDTDEVIISGDSALDGADMYPYLFGATEVTNYQSHIFQFVWEWNEAAWFVEYRDWNSGNNKNTLLNLRQNTMPLKTAAEVLDVSNNFKNITNGAGKVTWGEKLRPGQEFIWTQLAVNQNGSTKNNMIIGVLDSDFDGFSVGFRFKRTGELRIQDLQDGGVTVQAGISTTATSGQSCRLKYDAGDNKLKLDVVRAGVRETMAVSNSALDGNPVFISMGGDSTRIPTSTTGVEVYGWEIAHEPPNYYNPWKNWRIGGFPENQTSVGPGIHSTGNVLAYAADQVWRHKDGIPQGYKMHWLLPTTQINSQIGQWSSSNASSGLTNVENLDTFWDWSWQTNTSEEIDALKGWSFNTSNSNYSSDKWTDPNPGSTKFSIRYHSNNTVDIFDESNSDIIATKDVNADGNPIYISWAAGGATNNQAQMQDDFFGGGDVGIALTSATV
tara:strand:+ start:6349 stop:9126 length:2778 start_codon:yes stop_codon:yes gene_type:complete